MEYYFVCLDDAGFRVLDPLSTGIRVGRGLPSDPDQFAVTDTEYATGVIAGLAELSAAYGAVAVVRPNDRVDGIRVINAPAAYLTSPPATMSVKHEWKPGDLIYRSLCVLQNLATRFGEVLGVRVENEPVVGVANLLAGEILSWPPEWTVVKRPEDALRKYDVPPSTEEVRREIFRNAVTTLIAATMFPPPEPSVLQRWRGFTAVHRVVPPRWTVGRFVPVTTTTCSILLGSGFVDVTPFVVQTALPFLKSVYSGVDLMYSADLDVPWFREGAVDAGRAIADGDAAGTRRWHEWDVGNMRFSAETLMRTAARISEGAMRAKEHVLSLRHVIACICGVPQACIRHVPLGIVRAVQTFPPLASLVRKAYPETDVAALL